MKVLWLSSYPVPQLCDELGLTAIYNEGWKSTLFDQIRKNKSIDFVFVFPNSQIMDIKTGLACGVRYYMVTANKSSTSYSSLQEQAFTTILNQEKPDVIHIWGTEFSHALAMVNSASKVNLLPKVVGSLQGIMGECANSYDKCLPIDVKYRRLIGDLLLGRGIQKEKKGFKLRAQFESGFISEVQHVIGRTDFDRAYCLRINPLVRYHYCAETLREEFYSDSWTYEKCVPHTLFISQAAYPIKGLHLFLEALNLVVSRFPDTMVYISGGDILTQKKGFRSLVKRYSYSSYLRKLISKYQLTDHIKMLGPLQAEEMKKQYLKANVFVSSSVIENSPNSVGEAMLLGVPIVASNVGGTNSVFTHGVDGYLYQYDLPYMCAYYICSLFAEPESAKKMGENARQHARLTHDPENNLETLMGIYTFISRVEGDEKE